MSEDESRRVEFRVLGSLEVRRGGMPLALGAPRERGLLAFLLLHANEVVPRARLIDALWGERPPETAVNGLQVAVHGLRKLVGPDRIGTEGSGYRLRVAAGELDLARAVELVDRARTEKPAAAVETADAALRLWRGRALCDVTEAPFAQFESDRLEELRLEAIELRIGAELDLGRHAELVGELRALVAEHPFRERLRGQLMLALYRSGRQAEALSAYQETRAALVDHLGIEPSADLRELERAILRQDSSLALAPVASELSAPTNLPAPVTPLVGRRLELAAVTGLLRRDDVRLLTLTGAGGTGKTRLALAAGSELGPELADGVVFADLAPLEDPALVASTIAHAVGTAESGRSAVDALKHTLRGKQVLLLLDNFERVDEAAPLVSELLAAAAGLKVLATSRGILRLSGEHEYPVPPLRIPETADARDPESLLRNEAVALFVARAQAARPDFGLTSANASTVAEICIALDGLPLALELAAARIRLLSPEGLLARLGQRLDVLTGGPRDVPARQRTLRATVDWSYDLLDPPERELFAQLAVFAGGCADDAAQAVCGAAGETLEALLDKSLLQREEGAVGEARLRMLETVREYAQERFQSRSDADALRRRHAAYFVGLAEEAGTALWGPVQGPERTQWLDRLEHDLDNLRAALAWADRHDPETMLRLAAALVDLWLDRGYLLEGRDWLERAIGSGESLPAALRAKALHGACYASFGLGDFERGDTLGEASVDLYRELGDEEGVGRNLHVLGQAAAVRGDVERWSALAEQSLALARKLGHVRGVIVSLASLGAALARRGEHDRAEELLQEGLAVARDHADDSGEAYVLLSQGESVAAKGEHESAGRLFAASLALYVPAGHTRATAICIERLGVLAVDGNRIELGVRLLSAAEHVRESIRATAAPAVGPERERAIAAARATLGDRAFTEAWVAGRKLSLEQAVECALASVEQPSPVERPANATR